MIVTRKLGGHSEGKGRNGYIKIVEMEASVDFGDGQRLRLEVFSKVRGDVPPIVLVLAPEDVSALHHVLSDYLAGDIK